MATIRIFQYNQLGIQVPYMTAEYWNLLDFGFEFGEIFVIKKQLHAGYRQLPVGPMWGVVNSVDGRYGESPTPRVASAGNQ